MVAAKRPEKTKSEKRIALGLKLLEKKEKKRVEKRAALASLGKKTKFTAAEKSFMKLLSKQEPLPVRIVVSKEGSFTPPSKPVSRGRFLRRHKK
jgi:hypothetical protein